MAAKDGEKKCENVTMKNEPHNPKSKQKRTSERTANKLSMPGRLLRGPPLILDKHIKLPSLKSIDRDADRGQNNDPRWKWGMM